MARPQAWSSCHLACSGKAADRRFDLDQPFYLQWMYEIVLREANTHEELRTWLDSQALHGLWAVLHLPHGVRRAWEAVHPSLRAARVASAVQALPHFDDRYPNPDAA